MKSNKSRKPGISGLVNVIFRLSLRGEKGADATSKETDVKEDT
jgi:hypothetical protein